HFLDPGVFIRSMANRGALGGLSEAALQAALLMDASGRDVILLETVGVGQAEVDIIDHADTVVLVLMPGSGDSIQALKAGVMEIPGLTGPFAAAAAVLCVAGVAKLGAPAPAVRAMAIAGFPVPALLVRIFAAGEVALGVWSVSAPGRAAAVVLTCAYVSFGALSLLLVRRGSSCGCFGPHETPATTVQAILSA